MGNVFGDISIGGNLVGRIAVCGNAISGLPATRNGILGNVTLGGLNSTSVIVSGGLIGDSVQGTALKYSGSVAGVVASVGATNYGNSQMTSGHTFQNLAPTNFDALAILGIWMSGGSPLFFDIAPLDLQGLALMLTALANLKIVSNATPTVTVSDAGGA